MASSESVQFPSPIGGVAFPSDLAPSVVFVLLYSFLLLLLPYRIRDPKSRNMLMMGAALFATERIVLFSLRAVQSHDSTKRVSKILTTYMQITFGMGFIGVAQNILHSLVKSALGTTHLSEQTDSDSSKQLARRSLSQTPPPSSEAKVLEAADHKGGGPPLPFWRRYSWEIMKFPFVAAIVPGVISNSRYESAMSNQDVAETVMRLRYVSSAIALILIISIACGVLWVSAGTRHRPESRKLKAILLLMSISGLLTSPAIYRLAVMYNKTSSLTSISPSSLNTPGTKATFYIFHMVPEWISVTLSLWLDVGEIFDVETDEEEEMKNKDGSTGERGTVNDDGDRAIVPV